LSRLSASVCAVTPRATLCRAPGSAIVLVGPGPLGLAMAGRSQSLAHAAPLPSPPNVTRGDVAAAQVSSMSCLCPGPNAATGQPTASRSCHSLTACAHPGVTPVRAPPRPRRPRQPTRGDPRANPLPPLPPWPLDPCYSFVAWWSHLSPIRFARRFAD
jgi:hypothetical protein